MSTDSYYAIGKSHTVCQDVARHGDGKRPFIAVCDGCSGSPQTELGAQVLAQTIATLLQPDSLSREYLFRAEALNLVEDAERCQVRSFGLPAIYAAAHLCDALRAPRDALDATLMVAAQTEMQVQAAIWGDGAIMWRQRSGRRVLVSIDFKHGAPAYLSYRLDAKRLAGYREQTEDGLRTISTYEDTGNGFKLSALYEDTGMEPFALDFPIEDVDLVLLASDGLGSFQRRVDSHFEAVPINEVADKAFAFKSMAGSFVARRMRRFLTVEAPALGWHHDDDLSVAAIHVENSQ